MHSKLCALFLLGALVSPAFADGFSRLVVFGDSLSDAGNTFQLTSAPQPPYYNGHYSNGPVWVEDLAPLLGLPTPTASLVGGPNATDYAFGDATTTGAGPIPSVQAQVAQFLSSDSPSPADLFTLQGGTNDVRAGQLNGAIPAQNIADAANSLANAGAKHILVMNLPRLGETPAERGTFLEGFLNSLTDTYNQSLATDLQTVRLSHPGLDLRIFDASGLLQQLMDNPAAYGFANVTDPAFNGTSVVSNPDEYLFWDTGHPTAAAHQLLATRVATLLPEPTSCLLFLAMAGAALLRRRPNRASTRQES